MVGSPSAPSHEKTLAEELLRIGKKIKPVVLLLGQPCRGKRTFVNWYHRDLIIQPTAEKHPEPLLLISQDPPAELSDLPSQFCASNMSFLVVDDPVQGKPYFKYCHVCICFVKEGDDVSYLPLNVTVPTHYFVPKADLKKQSQCVTEVGKVSAQLNEQLGEFKPVESVGLAPLKEADGMGLRACGGNRLSQPHEDIEHREVKGAVLEWNSGRTLRNV
eukprot:GEMP01096391.1.p1 GENE.GEMP01096391.1~~GEMP01096391.1.p1  ORF type:complete len:217 (+),score=28.77 GEMP01096391.1:35-685(+)